MTDRFSMIECVDAVKVSIDFLTRNGMRPLPFRMRALIVALNVNEYAHRPNTDELRVEMVERIKTALAPWCTPRALSDSENPAAFPPLEQSPQGARR